MQSGWKSLLHWNNLQVPPGVTVDISAELTVPVQWPEFSGHFPGNPVLPAVSIVDISIEFIRQVDPQASFEKFALEKTRFVGRVAPGQKVHLVANKKGGQLWLVIWKDLESGDDLAELQVSF